jgi:hypothetical protein
LLIRARVYRIWALEKYRPATLLSDLEPPFFSWQHENIANEKAANKAIGKHQTQATFHHKAPDFRSEANVFVFPSTSTAGLQGNRGFFISKRWFQSTVNNEYVQNAFKEQRSKVYMQNTSKSKPTSPYPASPRGPPPTHTPV